MLKLTILYILEPLYYKYPGTVPNQISSMVIKEAKFLMSNTRVEDCPAPDKPEYAFIGRSNVGKSSLINMLTEQKGLAKTSASPGKRSLLTTS